MNDYPGTANDPGQQHAGDATVDEENADDIEEGKQPGHEVIPETPAPARDENGK